MLCTMPSRSGSVVDAKAVTRIYADDLADLPPAEVREAIRGFRRGELGDLRWAPTVGEIRMAVLRRLGQAPEQLAEKAEFASRMAYRDKIEREALSERGRREAQWASLTDEERARAVELAEIAKRQLSAASGKGGKIWSDDIVSTTGPVSSFSPKLVAQLRGEIPIGEGKLGPQSLVTADAAE